MFGTADGKGARNKLSHGRGPVRTRRLCVACSGTASSRCKRCRLDQPPNTGRLVESCHHERRTLHVASNRSMWPLWSSLVGPEDHRGVLSIAFVVGDRHFLVVPTQYQPYVARYWCRTRACLACEQRMVDDGAQGRSSSQGSLRPPTLPCRYQTHSFFQAHTGMSLLGRTSLCGPGNLKSVCVCVCV
jgi:hypothetical protein